MKTANAGVKWQNVGQQIIKHQTLVEKNANVNREAPIIPRVSIWIMNYADWQ